MNSPKSAIEALLPLIEAQEAEIKILTEDYVSKKKLTSALNQIERLTFPSKGKILRILANTLL